MGLRKDEDEKGDNDEMIEIKDEAEKDAVQEMRRVENICKFTSLLWVVTGFCKSSRHFHLFRMNPILCSTP